MKLVRRQLRNKEDYWRMRDLARQALLVTGRQHLSWHVARFDYWWARRHEFLPDTPVDEVVFIWETSEGKLVAALLPEHPGIVFHQLHPEYRTRQLEEEMLAVAEEHLAVARDSGRPKLFGSRPTGSASPRRPGAPRLPEIRPPQGHRAPTAPPTSCMPHWASQSMTYPSRR